MKKQYLSIILLLVALYHVQKIRFQRNQSKTSNIIFENNRIKLKFNLIEYLYFYNGGGVAVGDINVMDFDIYLSNQER